MGGTIESVAQHGMCGRARANMAVTPKLMTWQEFAAVPDDGMQHELVRGELRTMAPPFDEHGRLADRLGRSLDRHVDAHQLGEVRRAEVGYLLTASPDT